MQENLEPEWTKDHTPEWLGSEDWMHINITVPNNSVIGTNILGMLRAAGFIEYEWCSLYNAQEGAVADYGPCEPPKYTNDLKDYINSLKEGH